MITGDFQFKASFDDRNQRYTINPQDDNSQIISDCYKLRIEVSPNNDFPDVFETENRIPSEQDFHKNPDDRSLCLVGPFDRLKKFSIEEFLDGPVLQFLYDQSYFKKYNIWPRGEYSHGTLGLIENYYEKISLIPDINEKCLILLSRSSDFEKYRAVLAGQGKIKSHHQCICGSGQIYRKCSHMKVFYGLWNLHKFVHKHQAEQRVRYRIGE